MASHVHGRRDAVTASRAERTPAQWYDLIFGATILLVGLLGFLADASFGTGDAAGGESGNLIVFEVNGWHNLVHIASGLFLLAMAGEPGRARFGALAFAAVYGVVTLWGLIDGNDVLGLVAIDGADNVLHIVFVVTALAAGLARSSRPRADAYDEGRTGTR